MHSRFQSIRPALAPRMLLPNAQLANYFAIAISIRLLEVVKKPPTLGDQHQKSAPRTVILLVHLKMFRQFANTLTENRNLHLRTSSVRIVGAKFADNVDLLCRCQHSASCSWFYMLVTSLSVQQSEYHANFVFSCHATLTNLMNGGSLFRYLRETKGARVAARRTRRFRSSGGGAALQHGMQESIGQLVGGNVVEPPCYLICQFCNSPLPIRGETPIRSYNLTLRHK